jgi:DNA-binding NarL/FixJ family response regulator
MTRKRLTLVIVDGHDRARSALTERLQRLADVLVLAAIGEIGRAIEVIGLLKPDVVLLEPRTGDGHPVATLCRFVDIGPPVVVLTCSLAEGEAESFMRAGASAVLLKDTDFPGLLRRLHAVIEAAPAHVPQY